MKKKIRIYSGTVIFMLVWIHFSSAQAKKLSPNQELARNIFKELIEINTTHSTGNTTVAALAIRKRFLDAGFPEKDIQITGPETRNRNIILRYHGTGKRTPLLLLSHLDVVEARRSDWSMDPFKLTEKDGFFYGRGTSDIKDGSAILVANFIRLKKEGYVPDRDLILVLTAGEEGGVYDGVEWLVNNRRSLIDAAFCINMDAGDPQLKNGKKMARTVQLSEKSVLNLELEVKNPGGHGSLPVKNNAIYHLAGGLEKMQAYNFPVQMSEITQSYFYKMSSFESGQLSEDMKSIAQNSTDPQVINRLAFSPYYNALMRTTCVATMLDAGHAINALPQSAKAFVNCRILPGNTNDQIVKEVNEMLNDSQIVIKVIGHPAANPPSPSDPELMKTVEQVTKRIWPGVPVIAVMDVGASDGIYLRSAGIPTYGISGVFVDEDDNRAHGRDERIGVKEFYEGVEYEYALIKAFSSGYK